MLRDDRILDLAEIHCDLDTDSRGRKSFEFDNHGVVAFARAVEQAAYAAAAQECEKLISERDEARAEREAMAKDAARYRWLRGSSCPDHSRRWTLWEIRHWRAPFWTGDLRHGDLDAAIDAQIEQERSEQKEG